MSTTPDWVYRAAHTILQQMDGPDLAPHNRSLTKERIVGIVAEHAKPLIETLEAARRQHYHCEDSWFCCGQCAHPDHGLEEGKVVGAHSQRPARCECGADALNAKIDEVLK